MEELVTLSITQLEELMKKKLIAAGLPQEAASETAKHLAIADATGVHSHGAVRMDYYAERIAKGGITLAPKLSFEKTGPATGIFHGDNGMGQYVCNEAMKIAIHLAKEAGIAYVGVEQTSHSGTMAYYVKKAAEEELIALAMCQSDPMAVPFGGTRNYFGTNPIAFAAPRAGHEPIVFDMATTVQAWGKILDARAKNQPIPENWAVDETGQPTTDPTDVKGLLPIAGAKGYGLMMMVDILAGSLLGLPFGKHVSFMYADLTEKRRLGQMFLVIDPKRFTDLSAFKEQMDQMVNELHEIPPVEGQSTVYYPGEISQLQFEKAKQDGVQIPRSIYEYLISEIIHQNKYGGQDAFAK